jgi:hypothetical protein
VRLRTESEKTLGNVTTLFFVRRKEDRRVAKSLLDQVDLPRPVVRVWGPASHDKPPVRTPFGNMQKHAPRKEMFMPCPAFGEWVWVASPPMKMRWSSV